MDDGLDALRSLLAPEESLSEAGDVDLAHGDAGAASDQEPIELRPPRSMSRLWDAATRTTPRKVVFFTLLAPLALYAAIDSVGSGASGWFDRLVGGVTCVGPRGSLARAAQQALRPRPFGPGADTIAVTDRRLLLVRRGARRDRRDLTVAFSAGLAEVADAQARPRGLLRRRVEVTFADASAIVLALPAFRSPSPGKVVVALHAGSATAS